MKKKGKIKKKITIGRELLNNFIFFFWIIDDNKKLLPKINIKKRELVRKFEVKFELYEISYILIFKYAY